MIKEREYLESFKKTVTEGYNHHGARWLRKREAQLKRTRNGEYIPVIDGKEHREWLVVPGRYGGQQWWHIYRRTNKGTLRYVYRLPFGGEAAAFIDDLIHGRQRVWFGGTQFKLKKVDKPPKGEE